MKTYLISHFGDINFEAENETVTKITWHDLTPAEREALRRVFSVHKGKFKEEKGEACLGAPIEKVHNTLAKSLKKRPITAIKMANGKLELSQDLPDLQTLVKKEAKAAVTTERPRRGDCPMPSPTVRKELIARNVLKVFLTPRQLADLETNNAFVSKGCDSGRDYMILNRWHPQVGTFGRIYDVGKGEVVCRIYDLNMPPAEEMLSLKLAIELDESSFINWR